MIVEDGDAAPSNATGSAVGMSVKPLFVSKRFAKLREFEVPHDMYVKMRGGRESGERWVKYAEDETLQNELRAAYHSDNAFLVTSAMTGTSSIVRKISK